MQPDTPLGLLLDPWHEAGVGYLSINVALICVSVIFRPWSTRAFALEWENITGSAERSMAAMVVLKPVWEQSTTMPTLFISSIT